MAIAGFVSLIQVGTRENMLFNFIPVWLGKRLFDYIKLQSAYHVLSSQDKEWQTEQDYVFANADSLVFKLITCVYCYGFWISIGLSALLAVSVLEAFIMIGISFLILRYING